MLPIQLWHLGKKELVPFWDSLVDRLNVTTVDALSASGASEFHRLGGWECKIHAIVSSPFEHILLLDADNIPLVDPTTLFESKQFIQYGQVFWPDSFRPASRYTIQRRAWRELELRPQDGLELETGQLLVNKRACWRELQIARVMNVHSDECYGHFTWGDKDTFALAWLLTGRPYCTVPRRPESIEPSSGKVIWQWWFDGRKVFQHQRKWMLPPDQMKSMLFERELLKEESLRYLQDFWDAARDSGQSGLFRDMLSNQSAPGTSGVTVKRLPAAASAPELQHSAMRSFQEGEVEQALNQLGRAVQLSPSDASYRVNLAALLCKVDRPSEAIPHLLAALRLKGDMPEVHNNLGVVMEQLKRYPQAIAAFRNALRLKPGYVDAQHNLGKAMQKAGDPQGSLEAFRDAVRHTPDSVTAREGLVTAAEEVGDAKLACEELRKLVELQPNSPGARSALLYTLHYLPEMGPARLYHEHREWDRRFGGNRQESKLFENDRSIGRRIRVGYVSPDFRDHTVPRFIGAALKHHDRTRFEVFCYSNLDQCDEVTDRLRQQVGHWRDIIGMPDEQIEQLLRDDRIDILVDLRGHASANRLTLFARRAAPIQMNMVGYFDTTGLSTMDYRLTDGWQDPPGLTEQFHTERLIRLPRSCWCYTADEDAPAVAPQPFGRSGTITFGSLNKIIKVSDPCARLWARVLEAVPNSRLLLAVVSDKAITAVRSRLTALGLPPERLLLMRKAESRYEYLERFGQIDVALDTYPFNGITTTCDGLWMGVPCVSLAGTTSVSRAGRSILHSARLGELSTVTEDAFVGAAVDLCRDRERLRNLRAGMRERLSHSELMDHLGFTRALEFEFIRVWEIWCQK